MCWQWARSSCAVAVVAPANPHGQVQSSGCAQSPKGPWLTSPGGPTQQFWPWWRNGRFAARVSSFFSIGNLAFLKACFSWDLFSAAGSGVTLVPTSCHTPNTRRASVHPLCVPHALPSQGRTKGTSSPCPTIPPCTLSGELTRAKWSSVCPWGNRERTKRHC